MPGPYSNVDELTKAAKNKQEWQRKLDCCAIGDLKIYENGTTFDDSGEPSKLSLNPGANVPPTESENNALIVVAPVRGLKS
eukprot:scaffold1190_cov69-Cylindrotheca_fusiformis.AAC.10